VRILLLLGVAVLAAACSSSPRLSNTFQADGISVRYPNGWDATSRPLTPVTDPAQVLAVASYRLPRDNRGADGCAPRAALDRLPPSGALVFGWELEMPSPTGLRPADFPHRPSHFRLTRLTETECLGRSYMVRFREAGRFFQVHVVLGPKAGDGTEKAALRILDSLRAQPR
jgi:hypothetical protein